MKSERVGASNRNRWADHPGIRNARVSQLGDIVPNRFHREWHEGRKVEREITTSERNPALRREALRHYGIKCMACDREPLITLREVEVHHLHPLADRGPANTTLDDVAVLCRNCHAIAHKDGNDVLPVEEIRAIVKKDGTRRTLMKF